RGTETGPIAGIDQHELGAGIDYDRIERRDDAALRHIGGFGGCEHLLVADITHEGGRERDRARAIAHDGDFEVAEFRAIEAWGLFAAERCGGVNGRNRRERYRRGGAGEHAAAGQLDHGVLLDYEWNTC